MGLQSFLTPDKLYFKPGCLPVALRELTDIYHAERVLVLADEEMLHNGRISLVTDHLHEMGLAYAVNSQSFAYDCVIFCGTTNGWQYQPPGVVSILIPTSFASINTEPWLDADMVILDENLMGSVQIPLILEAAVQSLHGGNASDYTLAWAVQAIRMVQDGGDLFHAAALAGLANAIAAPQSKDINLLPDAAEALGMTETELKEQICSYD